MKAVVCERYGPPEVLELRDVPRPEPRADDPDLVRRLESEACQRPDALSADVLAGHLQLLLSYCQRFYARQFRTRADLQGGVGARFERLLGEYFESGRAEQEGLPTVQVCAKQLGYSPDYLSDLLRAETGRGAREHIHHVLIETAKARLTVLERSVSEIAYGLGFEHPQHFSKLFKQKAGATPGDWRSGRR
jgi:AraC family transcriptional activator of pobA